MKKENNKVFIIDIMVFFITNIVSIILLEFNSMDKYNLMFLAPIVFEVCYFFSLRKTLTTFKVFGFTFIGIAFIRYVLLPSCILFIGEYNGRGYIEPTIEDYNKAFILTYYELFICSIAIFFLTMKSEINTETKKLKSPKSNLIYYGFIIFILIMSIINFEVFSMISFITPKQTKLVYTDMSMIKQITVMGMMVAKQLLFVILTYKCYEKYSTTNKKIYLLFSLLLLLLNSVVYFGSNRSDFVLMVAASLIYWITVFNKKNTFVILGIISLGAIIFLSITEVRHYSSISKNQSKIIDWTDQLQTYSGGIYNVAESIVTKKEYPEYANIKTLIFDFARPTLGINLIVKKMNLKYSNLYFNYSLFGYERRVSQIMPAIGEGYYCLGPIFSPLIDVIFIYIAFKLKKKLDKENRIELVYFYTITMIRIGFIMGQNATIQMNDLSFNLFIPIVLMWLNNNIVIRKEKNDKKI